MIIYTEGDKEKNHKPKIDCPDTVKPNEEFDLKIYVEGHPNKLEHSIRFIDVYFEEDGRDFNPIKIGKAVFTPEYLEPAVTLKMKISKKGKLVAISYCNKHGLWMAEKEIDVE